MSNKKETKKETLHKVQQEILHILTTLERYSQCDAELYICNKDELKRIQDLDSILFPLRTEAKKSRIYSVNKIVNIINPEDVAYDFKVVQVKKYVYIKDKEKCLQQLSKQLCLSENIQRKLLDDELSENDYSEDFKFKLKKELEEKLKKERELANNISNNPDSYDLLISGYKEAVVYEQINYGIKKDIIKKRNGKEIKLNKVRCNKHLSIKKPNIIVYEEGFDDKKRADMEVAYLEKKGYKIALRGVFYKDKEEKTDE